MNRRVRSGVGAHSRIFVLKRRLGMDNGEEYNSEGRIVGGVITLIIS